MMFLVTWLYGSRELLRPDADPREVSGITRSYLPGTPTYAAAALLAFVSPIVSLVAFGAIALFYVLSSSLFGSQHEVEAASAVTLSSCRPVASAS
jgi:hypothetical protein